LIFCFEIQCDDLVRLQDLIDFLKNINILHTKRAGGTTDPVSNKADNG